MTTSTLTPSAIFILLQSLALIYVCFEYFNARNELKNKESSSSLLATSLNSRVLEVDSLTAEVCAKNGFISTLTKDLQETRKLLANFEESYMSGLHEIEGLKLKINTLNYPDPSLVTADTLKQDAFTLLTPISCETPYECGLFNGIVIMADTLLTSTTEGGLNLPLKEPLELSKRTVAPIIVGSTGNPTGNAPDSATSNPTSTPAKTKKSNSKKAKTSL